MPLGAGLYGAKLALANLLGSVALGVRLLVETGLHSKASSLVVKMGLLWCFVGEPNVAFRQVLRRL